MEDFLAALVTCVVAWFSGLAVGMVFVRPRYVASRALFVLGDLIGAIGTQLYWLAQALLAMALVLMQDAARVSKGRTR